MVRETLANAFFAYSDNDLIDTDHGVIPDVEAARSIRTAEVGATRTMIARTRDRFGLSPERLAADTAHVSGEMLGWLAGEGIEAHIPVIDKSERRDGTFSNAEFRYDLERDEYTCPGGKALKTYWRRMKTPRDGVSEDGFRRYYARQADCAACALKDRCCPNQPRRKIARHVHEAARDAARRIATTDAYVDAIRRRKKVEMLFAHLKRILRLDRLRLRGPNGARDEFLLADTAQNLRKLARLIPATPASAQKPGPSTRTRNLIAICRPTSSTQSARSGCSLRAARTSAPRTSPQTRTIQVWNSTGTFSEAGSELTSPRAAVSFLCAGCGVRGAGCGGGRILVCVLCALRARPK
jgi:hypothetical protein